MLGVSNNCVRSSIRFMILLLLQKILIAPSYLLLFQLNLVNPSEVELDLLGNRLELMILLKPSKHLNNRF